MSFFRCCSLLVALDNFAHWHHHLVFVKYLLQIEEDERTGGQEAVDKAAISGPFDYDEYHDDNDDNEDVGDEDGHDYNEDPFEDDDAIDDDNKVQEAPLTLQQQQQPLVSSPQATKREDQPKSDECSVEDSVRGVHDDDDDDDVPQPQEHDEKGPLMEESLQRSGQDSGMMQDEDCVMKDEHDTSSGSSDDDDDDDDDADVGKDIQVLLQRRAETLPFEGRCRRPAKRRHGRPAKQWR